MADLCVSTDVTSRVPSLASHPALAALISSASLTVENYCRRTFAYSASIDEYHNGNGWSRLWLRRPPIASVALIEISGSAIDVTQLNVNTDNNSGEVIWGSGYGDYRFGAKFPRGRHNIHVQYAGGFQTIPGPVVEATVQVVKCLADAAKASPVYVREKIGDYEYQQAANVELPSFAQKLLAPYVLEVIF